MSEFLVALKAKHPDTVLISGGARGVDKHAESTWISLGCKVISFRPKQRDPERFVIEVWELGSEPRIYTLEGHPTTYNYASACLYRDMLIAEECDRLVAFLRAGGSRGAGFTVECARNEDKPVYLYEAEHVEA